MTGHYILMVEIIKNIVNVKNVKKLEKDEIIFINVKF